MWACFSMFDICKFKMYLTKLLSKGILFIMHGKFSAHITSKQLLQTSKLF